MSGQKLRAAKTVVATVKERGVRLPPFAQRTIARLRRCHRRRAVLEQLRVVLHEIRKTVRFAIAEWIPLIARHTNGLRVRESRRKERLQTPSEWINLVEQVINTLAMWTGDE